VTLINSRYCLPAAKLNLLGLPGPQKEHRQINFVLAIFNNMKTLAILISSVAVNLSPCLGQKHELELIIRPALTSLRGNEAVKNNLDPKISLSTGIAFHYSLKENSALNFAILHDAKGGVAENYIVYRDQQGQIVDEGNVTININYQYITIPVQWQKRFGRKITYQFGAGIYTSFLLKQEDVAKGLNGLIDDTQDRSEMFKPLDFGFVASFSSFFPINEKLSLKIGLDDFLGVTNVSAVPVANKGTIKHNSFGLTAGLILKLK